MYVYRYMYVYRHMWRCIHIYIYRYVCILGIYIYTQYMCWCCCLDVTDSPGLARSSAARRHVEGDAHGRGTSLSVQGDSHHGARGELRDGCPELTTFLVYIHISIISCKHIQYTYSYTHTYNHMCTYIYVYIYIYIRVYIYIYSYIYI